MNIDEEFPAGEDQIQTMSPDFARQVIQFHLAMTQAYQMHTEQGMKEVAKLQPNAAPEEVAEIVKGIWVEQGRNAFVESLSNGDPEVIEQIEKLRSADLGEAESVLADHGEQIPTLESVTVTATAEAADGDGVSEGAYSLYREWKNLNPEFDLNIADLSSDLKGRLERAQTVEEIDVAMRLSLSDLPEDLSLEAKDTRHLKSNQLSEEQIARLQEEAQAEQNPNRRVLTFGAALMEGLTSVLLGNEQARANENMDTARKTLAGMTVDNISEKVAKSVKGFELNSERNLSDTLAEIHKTIDDINQRPLIERKDVEKLNGLITNAFDDFRGMADRARRMPEFTANDENFALIESRRSDFGRIQKRVEELSLTHKTAIDPMGEVDVRASKKLMDENLESMMSRINQMMDNLRGLFSSKAKDSDNVDGSAEVSGLSMMRP